MPATQQTFAERQIARLLRASAQQNDPIARALGDLAQASLDRSGGDQRALRVEIARLIEQARAIMGAIEMDHAGDLVLPYVLPGQGVDR